MLAVAGVLCGILLGGRTGGALAFGLLLFGSLGVLFLIYIEVGRSEDRERAQDEQRRRELAGRQQDHVDSQRPPPVTRPRWKRRPN